MTYRDDLAAAQARADAAMRSLANEREARADDAGHVAGLERALAHSLQELAGLREQMVQDDEPARPHDRERNQSRSASKNASPNPASTNSAVVAGLLLLGVAVIGLVAASRSTDSVDTYVPPAPYPAPKRSVPHEVPSPQLTSFDVSSGVSEANTLAQTYFGDDVEGAPYLIAINASAVDDAGQTQFEYGDVIYHFAVKRPPMPTSPKPESKAPIGARPSQESSPVDTRRCHVEVRGSETGLSLPSDALAESDLLLLGTAMSRHSMDFKAMTDRLEGYCEQPEVALQCTLAQVRKRALAMGAPAGALASVSIGKESASQCSRRRCLRAPETPCCTATGSEWLVRIVDRGETIFEKTIPDNCQ